MPITYGRLLASDGWLATKNENELEGIPLNATLSYTGDQLTQVIKGSVTKDFTYNMDGTLNTVDDGTWIKTMGYTGNNLTSITVTAS